MPGSGFTLDGGWGWVMVACGFVVHVLIYGAHYSLGVLYVSWLEEFSEGKAATSWIVSIAFAIMWTIGPLPVRLMKRFGEGPVQVMGAVLAFLGFALASQATSVAVLIASIGIIGGVGAGLVYLPCMTVIAEFFDKKRGVAFGIATSGVGIGAFLFSPVVTFLEEEYGWRGCLLILAAIELNMCICGMLVRPNPGKLLEEPLDVKEDIGSHTKTGPESSSRFLENPEIKIDDDFSECKNSEFHQLITTESVHNEREDDIRSGYMCNDETINQTSDEKLGKLPETRISEKLVNTIAPLSTSMDHLAKQIVGKGRFLSTVELRSSRNSVAVNKYDAMIYSSRSIQNMNTFLHGSIYSMYSRSRNSDLHKSSASNFVQPNGQDVFHEKEKSLEETELGLCSRKFGYCNDFLVMFKDWSFVLFTVSTLLTNLSYIMPALYLVDRAVGYGIAKSTAAMLLSINGVTNVITRLLVGFLADRIHFDVLWLFMGNLAACGVATALSVFCGSSFVAHGVYSAVFGITMGSYNTLFPVVTLALTGVEQMGVAYSILLPTAGISCLIGPPFAGWLCDVTGNFGVSFAIHGAFILLSAVILVPVACRRHRSFQHRSIPS